MFFGIDLTSTETKPSACVCLDDRLEVVFQGLISSDSDIATVISLSAPRVVAIDSPLSLPLGLCCLEEDCHCRPRFQWKGRWCEQELARRAAPCYFTTKKSIIKGMVYRAMTLKAELSQQGYEVIEVYPYASKVRLFGKPTASKTTALGLDWLRKRLRVMLPSVSPHADKWSHDLCDAAIAAYTGFLCVRGAIEAVGNVEEGLIYIPRGSCGRKEGG